MKANRLSEKLTAALNAQMTQEAHASQIYLSFAAWADNQGYTGIANFFQACQGRTQSNDETA